MDLEKVKTLIEDINLGKFRQGNNKLNDKILIDERINNFKEFANEVYVNEGVGFKTMIKRYELNVSYTLLRRIFIFLGYELHSNRIPTKSLIEQRSINAKKHYVNKTGFFKEGVQDNVKTKKTERGIQGYYWNPFKEKYVWLKSSWEFIYAKWLVKHNIKWDYELKSFHLSDGSTYKPDFYIYDDNWELLYLVEIKGFWKNRLYKTELLNKEYGIKVITIEDMSPYTELTLKKEKNIWRKLRKLESKK